MAHFIRRFHLKNPHLQWFQHFFQVFGVFRNVWTYLRSLRMVNAVGKSAKPVTPLLALRLQLWTLKKIKRKIIDAAVFPPPGLKARQLRKKIHPHGPADEHKDMQ